MKFLQLWLPLMLTCAICSCEQADRQVETKIGNAPAPTVAMPEKQPVIALILKTQTNPFFAEMEKGARRAEKEYSIKLKTSGGSQETSVQEQIELVEGSIAAKVDAIIISPSDSTLLVPVVKRAQDAGIRIINIDNSLDQKDMQNHHMQPIPLVSVDNETGSYRVVKSVLRQYAQPVEAAIIEGMSGAENGRLRVEGASRAFRENRLIKIVAHDSAHWKIDEAYGVAKNMFAAHPNIHVLFCANDLMALGAGQYIVDSGRKNVQVIGYDALEKAKQAIRSGKLAATVDQQAAEQGYQAVVFAVRALKGEKIPEIFLVDTKIVNAQSLN